MAYQRVNDLKFLTDDEYDALCDLFDRQVNKRGPDECWPWRDGTHKDRRGQVSLRGQTVPSSRLAYLIYNDDIPEHNSHHGLVVMHTCDNPPCCNPKHLVLGTQGDNLRDRTKKGRAGPRLKRVPDEAIDDIRTSNKKLKDLATEHGLSINLVWRIKNNKRPDQAARLTWQEPRR